MKETQEIKQISSGETIYESHFRRI